MNADEQKIEELLSQMTLKEKVDYIGGIRSFYIRGINRLHIPEIRLADGPIGVRADGSSTTYPAGINLAASWNKELAQEVGASLAQDARARGVHILLAPGVNLYRSSLCGRNFEYFGEDPHLTSRMAVAVINGIQSQNVAACVKHFVANNQEWNRNQVSSDVDERTLRELYLPAFEASVKEANVASVMASYNPVNGIHMSQNGKFNNDLLKNEWGFQGVLMSDWTSTYDGVEAANNGLDLEMPYAACMNRETLFAAIQHDKVQVATIDDKVRRILRLLVSYGFLETPQTAYRDWLFNHKGHIISRKMAEESIVLLKNDNILPLNPQKTRSLAVIGPCALTPVPKGGGSSDATPHLAQSYLAAISDWFDETVELCYAKGVPEFSFPKCSADPEGKETGFYAEYFDNTHLAGAASHTRIDRHINFQWKEKSYRKGGPVNHYSCRWTGYYSPTQSQEHTFLLSAADGFRLYVNDILLIDHWDKNSYSYAEKTITLDEGKQYKIRLEYFVGHGPQGIQFGLQQGKNRAIEEAQEAAASCETAIVFAGFGAELEGEDWDRPFQLPYNQSELIQAVASVNPNTIVVMSAGGNVDMAAWLGNVKGLFWAFYPGQEGAKAFANLLFGKISPSGKLPISLEKSLSDSATYASYHDKDNSKRVRYLEGIFLGYRHLDKFGIEPFYPFGYGLSYAQFSYSNLEVGREREHVSFDITNRSTIAASEVTQVYISSPGKAISRAAKELKGFAKVHLQPGETKRVTVALDERAFSYFDPETNSWKEEEGLHTILVGSSSRDIALTGDSHLPSE